MVKITMTATAAATTSPPTPMPLSSSTTPMRRSNSSISVSSGRSVASYHTCSEDGDGDVDGDGDRSSGNSSCSDSDGGRSSVAEKTRRTPTRSLTRRKRTRTTNVTASSLNIVVVRVGFLFVAGLLSSLQYKNAFYLIGYNYDYSDYNEHRSEDSNHHEQYLRIQRTTGRRGNNDEATATAAAATHLTARGDKTRTTTKTRSKTAPIFYNVFVQNKYDLERVQRDIVDDQLQHVNPTIHGPIYYTSLGPVPINITMPTTVSAATDAAAAADATADDEKISRIQHLETGDETTTLHSLWSYCKVHPTEQVVYLHSKGSFHPTTQNDDLRRLITTAALSKECSQATQRHNEDDDNEGEEQSGGLTCDVCSARFSPIPHAHTSGNMWMARCDYVSKLLDPQLVFRQVMDDAYPIVDPAMKHLKDVFDRLEFRNGQKLHCFGLGRYAAEHWIHSHPSVRPCDVYKNPEFVWGYKGIPPSTSLVETTTTTTSDSSTFVMDDGSNNSTMSSTTTDTNNYNDYYDFEIASAPRFESIEMYDLQFMLKTTCKQTIQQFWETHGQNLLNEYQVLYGGGGGGGGGDNDGDSMYQNRTDKQLLSKNWWGWKITEFRQRLLNGTFVTQKNKDDAVITNNETAIS